METCIACEAQTASVEVLPSYDDDAFGIPITIKNAVIRHRCQRCELDAIEIPDSEGLEAAIAVARITIPIRLSGSEIKFLRKACGMTGREFAEVVAVDNATLSRWETCAAEDGVHGEVSDRRIRMAVWGILDEKAPALHIAPSHFTKMRIGAGDLPRLVFERVRLKDPVRHTKKDAWDLDEAA